MKSAGSLHTSSTSSEKGSSALLRTQQLRAVIAELHQAVEATQISQQLANGTISRKAYWSLHVRLSIIHKALDDQFRANEKLNPLLDDEDLRAEQLEQDLMAFDAWATVEKIGQSAADGMSPAESLVSLIQTSAKKPWTWQLGYLYVVKGARFGGKVLADPLSKALHVPKGEREGISYYLSGQEVLPAQWRIFKRQIDDMSLNTTDEEALFDGARELMRGFLSVYRCVSATLT